MMPYQVYQLYQAERPKSAAEIRRADDQLGRAAESVSRLWCRATQPIAILRGTAPRSTVRPPSPAHARVPGFAGPSLPCAQRSRGSCVS